MLTEQKKLQVLEKMLGNTVLAKGLFEQVSKKVKFDTVVDFKKHVQKFVDDFITKLAEEAAPMKKFKEEKKAKEDKEELKRQAMTKHPIRKQTFCKKCGGVTKFTVGNEEISRNQYYKYGMAEDIVCVCGTKVKEVVKTKKEVVTMKKAPPVKRVVTRMTRKDLEEAVAARWFGGDKKEAVAYVVTMDKAEHTMEFDTEAEMQMYLDWMERDRKCDTFEKYVKKYAPKEVDKSMHERYELPTLEGIKADMEKSEARVERASGRNAANIKAAIDFYKKYFDMYNLSIPSPIRTKIKEMVILYTTAINANGQEEARLIKGRIVSMVLSRSWNGAVEIVNKETGETRCKVVCWIDRKAMKATKMGKLFNTDGGKFKAYYARFAAAFNDEENIPEKWRVELDRIVKETEGTNSVMWWNIAIGMTPDKYQMEKYPTSQDTVNNYIEAETGKRPKIVVTEEEKPSKALLKKVKEAKEQALKEKKEQELKWAAGQIKEEPVRKVTKAQAAKPVAKARKK